MKALHCFKTSGDISQVTQHHIPEDLNPQKYHCGNLKSHMVTEYYKAFNFDEAH
jgi:hypothetical protein